MNHGGSEDRAARPPPNPTGHPIPEPSHVHVCHVMPSQANSREAPGEGTIADVLDLVHHERDAAELSPRSLPRRRRGDLSVPTAGGPDLARFLHPLAEVGIDLLVVRWASHLGEQGRDGKWN